MTVLLNRQAKIIVRKVFNPDASDNAGVTELVISGERIRFNIVKTDETISNKAKIQIYNLNINSRAFLENTKMTIQLFVGYKGLENDEILNVIFQGDITKTQSEKKGVDLVTTIEASDALTVLDSIIFQASYKAGNPYKKIIKDVIKKIGVPYSESSIDRLSNAKNNNGVTYSDKASDILTQLLKNEGYNWSIQTGTLEIKRSIVDANTIQVETIDIVIVSKETGMLGIPIKTNNGIMCSSLINPKIRPNTIINIISESLNINENFKVKNGNYKGDTHKEEWLMKMECLKWAI